VLTRTLFFHGDAFHCSHCLCIPPGLLPADGCDKLTPRTGTRMSADNTGQGHRATIHPSSMDSVVVGRRGDMGKAMAIAISYSKGSKGSKGNSRWETARHICRPLDGDEQPD